MRSKISVLTMMGMVLLLSSMAFLPVYATDVTVTDCTNFSGMGTISQAVDSANNGGGTISVTCTGTIRIDNLYGLIIRTNVTIHNDSGGVVVLDEAGDNNPFFFVENGASLTLDGFTLQNGNADSGGAISNYGTLT
ncbi:MAG: hypothetical protein KJ043_09830, partial [Anaerolineae bacterium]|nr:hypothetical protein [Anaerolineae bacterium]